MMNPHYNIQNKCEICKSRMKKTSHGNNIFVTELNENKLNYNKIIKNYEYITDRKKIIISNFNMKAKDFLKFILHLVRCNKRRKIFFIKDTICNSNNNNIENLDEGNNNMSDIHSSSTTDDKNKMNRENKKVVLNLAEEKAIVLNQMKIKEEKRKQLRALEEENRKKEETNRLEEKRKVAEFNEKDNEHQMRKLNLNKCDDYVNFHKEDTDISKDQVKAPKPYMKRIPADKTQKDKKPKETTSYPDESKIQKKTSDEQQPKEDLKEIETDQAIISEQQSDQGPKEGDNVDENLKNETSLPPPGENEEVATSKEDSRKGDTDKMSADKQIKPVTSDQEEQGKEIPKASEKPSKPSQPVVNKVPVSKTPTYQQSRGVTKRAPTQSRPTQPRQGQPRTAQPRSTQPRQTQPRQTQPRQTQPRQIQTSRGARAPMRGGNAKKINNAKAVNKKETPNGELNVKEQEVNVVEHIEEDNVKPSSCTEKDPVVKKSNAGCCQTDVKKSKPSVETEQKKSSIKNDQRDIKETEGDNVANHSKPDSHINNN